MRKLPLLLIPLLGLSLLGAGRCGTEASSATAPTTSGTSAGTGTGSSVTVPGSVLLAPGESARVEGRPVSLRFLRVLEDSRCPREVNCVWAGRARVEIEVTRDAAPASLLELEVASAKSAEAEGLRLTAETLDPYPSADSATLPDKYRLRLRIEAADA